MKSFVNALSATRSQEQQESSTSVDERIQQRLAGLIEQSKLLSVGNQYRQCADAAQCAEYSARITAALNAVHLVFVVPSAAIE